HQRDRALLRRSAQTNPAHGVLCQRRKRGSYHLLHLPEIQPGMEIPHPQPIYTSSLTSPPRTVRLTVWVTQPLRMVAPCSMAAQPSRPTYCPGAGLTASELTMLATRPMLP